MASLPHCEVSSMSESPGKPHVLIVGAGLGGLAAAAAMLGRGIDVDVYEQAPELGEIGAGISVSANGTAVLFALGLEQEIRYWGVPAGNRELRLWNTGQTWSLFSRGGPPAEVRYRYPMFTLHRVDLLNILIKAVRRLKPNAIHLSKRCITFDQQNGGVRVRFEDGGSAIGDVLVGADGIHSHVRKLLFGPASPRFTGQVAWRGLASLASLPEHQRRIAQTTWMGPTAHVSCYPVRRAELFNFVGQVDHSDWQVESWIEEGTVEECLADFEGWHDDIRRMITNNTRLYKWGMFLRDPLQRWTEGHVALLGDACHSMLPYLGQGANSTFEDAYVLARCLERWRSEPNIALKRYEALRRERATQIVHASEEMARTYHNKALANPRDAETYINTNWHPDKVGARYDWIYGYDAVTVPLSEPSPEL
jgi:salicylate hydroxylase